MRIKRDTSPLLVIVDKSRYECYGDPTPRNIWLFKQLQKMGGVNESVVPGRYHFNIKRRGLKLVATLLPAE